MITRYLTLVGRFTNWLILLGVPVFAVLVLFDEFGRVELSYRAFALVSAILFLHGAYRVWHTPEDV